MKALIDLGLHSENETVSLQSIAERQDISVSYLEQLMAMLKKAGLVTSSRGAYGGYSGVDEFDEANGSYEFGNSYSYAWYTDRDSYNDVTR